MALFDDKNTQLAVYLAEDKQGVLATAKDTTVFKKPHLEAEQDGKMVEWFKAPVLKTGVGAPPPRVRIPLFPPLVTKK